MGATWGPAWSTSCRQQSWAAPSSWQWCMWLAFQRCDTCLLSCPSTCSFAAYVPYIKVDSGFLCIQQIPILQAHCDDKAASTTTPYKSAVHQNLYRSYAVSCQRVCPASSGNCLKQQQSCGSCGKGAPGAAPGRHSLCEGCGGACRGICGACSVCGIYSCLPGYAASFLDLDSLQGDLLQHLVR